MSSFPIISPLPLKKRPIPSDLKRVITITDPRVETAREVNGATRALLNIKTKPYVLMYKEKVKAKKRGLTPFRMFKVMGGIAKSKPKN